MCQASFRLLALAGVLFVPFGSIHAEGFVWEVHEGVSQDCGELKYILDAPDDAAWFDTGMLELARWISDYYVCAPGEALRMFIPGKSSVRSENYYHTATEVSPLVADRIFEFIRAKGSVSFSRLRSEFGTACRADLLWLIKNRFVYSTPGEWSKKLQ